MSDFFKALKDDLTDRRLMPIVICVGVLLFAAVAYAALAGGGSSSTPAAAVAVTHTHGASGIAISQAESASGQALAETTDGSASQRHGAAHDPFAQLPGTTTVAVTKVAASSPASGSGSTSSSPSSSGGGSESSSSTSGSTETSSSHTNSSPPSKPKTVYHVAVQFGKLPTGVKPEDAELPSYENLTKPRPLPNSKEALIEFLGVTVSHVGTQYSAAFALEGEVILHGTGTCRPSAAQCKVLDIKEKETEQLEYLTSTGELATWELRVVSITSSKASAAAVGSKPHAQAHTASAPLGGVHVLDDAGMRYSAQSGLIVLVGHPAFGHAASRRHR